MRKTIAILIIGLFLSVNPIFAKDSLVVSGHPNYPPITWKKGDTIVGVAAELVKTILTELQIPFEIKATGPWIRVQQNARNGTVDMITSAYINEARKHYMEYSIPFITDPSVIFVLKGNGFTLNRWEDLIGKQGTTTLGESYGEEFDQFIETYLKMDRVKTHIQNFKKLEKGRADYMLFPLYPGQVIAQQTGYADMIEILPKVVYEANFYVTFSKKSKFKYLLPQINKMIRDLKSKGTIEKWFHQFQTEYREIQNQAIP